MSKEHYKSYHPEEQQRPQKKRQPTRTKKSKHKHQYEDVWLQYEWANIVTTQKELHYLPGARCTICNKLMHGWEHDRFNASKLFLGINQQVNDGKPIIFVDDVWNLPKGD